MMILALIFQPISVTPPNTPSHQDISVSSPQPLPSQTPTSSLTSNTAKRCRSGSYTDELPAKRNIFVKQGRIVSDEELMDIARDVNSNWQELATYLNVSYSVIQSIAIQYQSSESHMMSYHMLQKWKKQSTCGCNYETLGIALGRVGLQSLAVKYCYEYSNYN